jgi:hypothetical protein
MNESNEQFSRLLGQAAVTLWPDLPRVVQERLFETAVRNVSTILRQASVEFKLGCLGFSAVD